MAWLRRLIGSILYVLATIHLGFWITYVCWRWREEETRLMEKISPLSMTRSIKSNHNKMLTSGSEVPANQKSCQTNTTLSSAAKLQTTNKFLNYSLSNPEVFVLPKLAGDSYFSTKGNIPCLAKGTVRNNLTEGCQCKEGWFGQLCSIPPIVKHASFDIKHVEIRDKPRRIIHGFPFNCEFDLIEAKLEEMGDVVDVFLVVESNYTHYGDPKDRVLLRRLQGDFLKKWHHKLVYVPLDFFPEEARQNGWLAEELSRNHVAQAVTKQLSGLRPDDIFILSDTDEIIISDVLLFLKTHDGYPTPLGMNLWQTIYGFFWRGAGGGDWTTVTAFPVSLLPQFLKTKGSKGHSRGMGHMINDHIQKEASIPSWVSKPEKHFAGWHCAWCFQPRGIIYKLISAINADHPRWGDYPEKRNVSYIANLIKSGTWFDDKTRFVPVPRYPQWVPMFFVQRGEKYQYLLQNPYSDM